MTSPAGNVLIIDNNQAHHDILALQLQRLGYIVVSADDGRQALDLLAEQRFKLILLSISLWGMNSYQILGRLNDSGILRSTAVIVLTPADNTLGIDRCLELGASDYLPEPFSPPVLKVRIAACLAQQELRDYQQSDEQREALLKIEHDVHIARQIQLGFLPRELPQPHGWEIAARFHPAREVAGDFYDAFMLTQNRRVGFVIADVCDKGVGAALFMALSRSLIHAFAQQHYNTLSWMDVLTDDIRARPRETGGRQTTPIIGANALKNAVVLTNNYITTNHLEMNMFFTLFFGVLDPATGALLYVNAGHCPPVIVGPDGLQAKLGTTGPAIGLFPEVQFEIARAQLEPGDTLFCYTDGVTDARTPSGEFFDAKRLHHLLEQSDPAATVLLNRIESSVHAHIASAAQFDDITMLAVRRVPAENLL
jgi:serine phosphatase RsbU (regulator of sigma subunit)